MPVVDGPAGDLDAAGVDAQEPGDGLDDRGLAGAVRSDQRHALVGTDHQVDVDVTVAQDDVGVHAGHVVTVRAPRIDVTPMTTTATTTSTSASATAVSGSISRCR